MNKAQSSRSLMLEQLESRYLLAGVVLSQSFGHLEQQDRDAPAHAQLNDARPISLERSSHGRSDSGRTEKFRRERGESHREADSIGTRRDAQPHKPGQNSSSRTPPPPTSQPQLRIVFDIDLGEPSPQSPASSQPQLLGQGAPAAAGPDAVTVRLTNAESETNTEIARQRSSQTGVATDAVSVSSHVAFDDQSKATGWQYASHEVDVVKPATEIEPSDEYGGGSIELLPQLRRELQAATKSDNDDEPWQLDPRAIERLREVIRESGSTSEAVRCQDTDLAIASWFNNQTGLIEIEVTGKLQPSINLSDSIVDVVLNATVGLHRSVDLLATATANPDPVPDDIRGAILAAIAAEQGLLLNDPLTTHTSPRVSALTYPGAALVAAGIMMAARRKRAIAKLEVTSAAKPSNRA